MADLASRLRQQAASCREYRSPLTGALLEGAADDLHAGGVVADLLGPHAEDPIGSVAALRFAGALHRLVLMGRAPELARHYPSVGGTEDVERVWPAAERACREHLAELRTLVRNPVQTNEVGRSAALMGVLALLDGPVRLWELGASAGLNLRCEHYAYEVGPTVLGDPASAVRLVQPWTGSAPAPANRVVVERRGCDPNPVDPLSAEGRLTLQSYVWGDQVERLARLRGALEVAARVPADVQRSGALAFLSENLPRLPDDGVTTLVWHSVVWQYLDPAEREAVQALLAGHAGPAVVHAGMEPEQLDGQWAFRVHLQRPGGPRVHVADSHGHGPPVHWTGARLEG